MRVLLVLLALSDCTNVPIVYTRNPEGIYPWADASLNGPPEYFFGFKHYFERAK